MFNKRLLAILVLGMMFGMSDGALADAFGSGLNSFDITFVPIVNPDGPAGEHFCGRLCGIAPGNRPDNSGSPRPAGSVEYDYRMGKFEISEQMIDKANALGNLGITKDTRGPDKPATSITWFEAAKFINWLNIDKGHTPAYKFDGNGEFQLWDPSDAGYDSENLFRNRRAKYFLPSADEWYKAAYYDPTTPNGTWYDYPTGSFEPPTSISSGTDPGTAVYRQDFSAGPADITQAGGLSPYGTIAQGGNVMEWEETEIDLDNSSATGTRLRRGGPWDSFTFDLSVTAFGGTTPSSSYVTLGFRVASVPEPGTLALIGMSLIGILGRRSTK